MSFRAFRDVLPSGLRVVTLETPHLHTALLAAYVRTGSRHERPENNGVSHFLEHLFFRGSAAYPDTVGMNALVEDVGGNLNGITARDHGCYYTPVHPDRLGVVVEVLGDLLARPLLRDVEVERQIILEEMLDEVDEDGNDIDLDNLVKRELYGEHPMGLKIAGTRHSVAALTLEQIQAHFARHYVTGNLVVTVAGRVERAQALALVERAFAHIPRGPATDEQPPPPPPAGPWFRFVEHDEAQTEFRLVFPAVPEPHPDYPALQLVRRVLDDGLSSRLPFEVVEKRGLAYSLHAGLEAYADCAVFEVEAASAPEKADRVLEAVFETLGQLCAEGPTEAEVARAKRRHRMFLEFAQDAPGELAAWFGGTELFRPPETFEERCARVEAQSAEDVRSAAERYFRKAAAGVYAVGQKKSARALERAAGRASGLR